MNFKELNFLIIRKLRGSSICILISSCIFLSLTISCEKQRVLKQVKSIEWENSFNNSELISQNKVDIDTNLANSLSRPRSALINQRKEGNFNDIAYKNFQGKENKSNSYLKKENIELVNSPREYSQKINEAKKIFESDSLSKRSIKPVYVSQKAGIFGEKRTLAIIIVLTILIVATVKGQSLVFTGVGLSLILILLIIFFSTFAFIW